MSNALHLQARSFALIGAVGFVVDGGILTVLHGFADFSATKARLVSFPVAVTLTWYLNRRRTFRQQSDQNSGREWARYAAVNSAGALLNLSIFLWLVHQWQSLSEYPVIPLAIAAVVALAFNFAGSKLFAFRPGQT